MGNRYLTLHFLLFPHKLISVFIPAALKEQRPSQPISLFLPPSNLTDSLLALFFIINFHTFNCY